MAENQWRWVGPDGFEYTGELETLKAGLGEGRLPKTTMVSASHLEGWLPAAEVAELGGGGFEPAAVAPQPLPAFQPEDDAPTKRDNPIPEPPEEAALPAREQVEVQPVALPPIADPPTMKLGAVRAEPAVSDVRAEPTVSAEPPTARVQALPRAQTSLLWIVLAVAAGAFVLGGLTVLLVVRGRADAPTAGSAAPTPSVASSGTADAAGPKGCIASRPALVARPVFGKIPLEVASAGPGRVAVAFASSRTEGAVVVLAAESLDKVHEKRQPSKGAVAGVRPLVRGDAVELVLDAEDPNLRGARSILSDEPLRIGAAPTGIARSAGDGEPEVVWPLAEKDLTPMRVESHDSVGYFVTLRSGGQRGKVLAGWLARDGSKKTDLSAPELAAFAVGTPAPTLSATATLLLVAAKPAEASPWQLFAGRAALGQAPTALTPLNLAGGDVERISPAAVALPAGGWLLQWTEGGEGTHLVQVQELDERLAAVGSAVRVSPSGSDSGQGRVWSDGARAVSFFLVSTGEAHELWAAPLACR